MNDTLTIPFFEAIKKYDGSPLPELTSKDMVLELKETDKNTYNILEPLILWAGGTGNAGITGSRHHNLYDYAKRVLLANHLLYDTELYNLDAIDLLNSLSIDNNSFVYLDPPYLTGNVGVYKPTSFNRSEMIEILQNAKYRWALSEYECQDLNSAFGKPKIFYYNVPIPSNKGGKTQYRTEVLYTNYSTSSGPNRLNFGDSERPIMTSRNIFQQYDFMTEKDFIDRCPDNWNITTSRAQFKRLTCIPEAYFDGKVLYNLDMIRRNNTTYW